MPSRGVGWAVAGGLAGWALARVAAVDRLPLLQAPVASLLSFTPQAVAGAWLAAVLLPDDGAAATAALSAAAMTAALAPRAIARRQPQTDGCALRVLTANMLVGTASADPIVGLVQRTSADVLFLQEITEDTVNRLKRAGLNDLLPNEVSNRHGVGSRGSAIYARYPLREDRSGESATLAQPAARLELPSGPVRLVCVHLRAPRPPWSRQAITRWREQLSALPSPDASPMILAGDFNSTLDHGQFRRLLRRGYVDAAVQCGRGLVPTWGPEPTGRPGLLAIDHVLVDSRCAVQAVSVHPLRGSDHRVVYAQIRLPA